MTQLYKAIKNAQNASKTKIKSNCSLNILLVGLSFHFQKLRIQFWFFFSISIDSKLESSPRTPFKNFEITIDIGVMTLYKMMQVLKNSTAFILSFVFSNFSKHFTRGLPNVGDALIYRAGILIYEIRVKYFRTFAFNVKVFRNFLGAIYWYNFYTVLLKISFYSFLKP